MFMDTLMSTLEGILPNMVYAVGVLIIGYIFSAIIASVATKHFVVKTGMDKKIAEFMLPDITGIDTGAWFKKNLFNVLMFYVLVSMFSALGITVIANLMAVLGSVLVFIIVVALIFKFDILGKLGNITK